MESGLIKDAHITASTQWDANHAAIQGRLNFLAGGGKQGGWSSRPNDVNQWIQVDLNAYTRVTQVATQGRNRVAQWVTKYKLQYSEDGVNFEFYKEPGQDSPKVIHHLPSGQTSNKTHCERPVVLQLFSVLLGLAVDSRCSPPSILRTSVHTWSY